MSKESFPLWLDASFFEKILQAKFKNSSVKVKSVKIEPCGDDGKGGFLSQLLRVLVNYHMNSTDDDESFVLKLATIDKVAVEKLGPLGHNVQKKEINFFELIAPQMEKVLKRLGDENVIVKVVAVDREYDVIVFEDLKRKNFDMPSLTTGLDVGPVKISLEKIAKFHAASIILNEKHPKIFKDFTNGIFSRNIDVFNHTHESVIKFVVEEVSSWSGFEKQAEKLEKLKPHLIEKILKCFDVKPGDFCVLNHGDLWKNNLMFKSGGKEEIQDAIMIDFQFAHWASPALDLIHFFYTSLSFELFKQDQIEMFVQFYYYELKEALLNLEYDALKIPSLHQLQLEILDKLFYGLILTSNVFPIMMSDDPDNDFMAHISDDERANNFKKRMLKNTNYQMIMKRMLPVFDEKGLLDV